jgi:hypothetical protein
MDAPIVAINKPTTVNDIANPNANTKGPYRCVLSAVPTIIGTSGKTHGDKMESNPARKLRP